MPKPQRTQNITKKQLQKAVTVENQKVRDAPLPESQPGRPIMAVHYAEVGDMEHKQVALLVSEITRQYNSDRTATRFFVPVRHGKISADVIFEKEILEFVNTVCEVKDGQIAMKEPIIDVQVVRNRIK